jgi:hypothetical protein
MALPVSFLEEQYADYGNEKARFKLALPALTAVNYIAKKALVDTLVTSITGIVIGNLNQETIIIDRVGVVAGAASSALAQRENKWLVRYHDASNAKKYRVEIPTADLTLLVAHAEFLDLTAGVGAAFKAAFEAIIVSPYDDSHAVVVDSVQFVGREA